METIKKIIQAFTILYLLTGIAFMGSGIYFFLNAIQVLKTL